MPDFKLIDTTQAIIDDAESAPIKTGQVIVTDDSERLYIDVSNSMRVGINDIIPVANDAQLLAIASPKENKFYLVAATNHTWIYKNQQWVDLTAYSASLAEMIGINISYNDFKTAQNAGVLKENVNYYINDAPEPDVTFNERLSAMMQWEDIKASRTTGVEVWTGVIDGADKVYGRVVAVGNLPNATTKRVPCNIENLSRKINISCIGMAPSTDSLITLPYANPSTSGSILLSFLGNDIYIDTGAFDRSNITAYAFVTYTCTDR